MSIRWGLTIDCGNPKRLAEFWALALGYVEPPPPDGHATWDSWLLEMGVPEQEWDDGAYLMDPDGAQPILSLLKVPEGKSAKNRLHIDVRMRERGAPWEERWPLVEACVERLVAAGATVLQRHDIDGRGHHVVMLDPEGNEFCVV